MIALLLAAAPVVGQTDPFSDLSVEEAAELLEILDQADQARDAERWRAALGGYQEFLSRVPDEYVALEVARCLRELGELDEADATYEALFDASAEEVRRQAGVEREAMRDAARQRVRFVIEPADALSELTNPSGQTRSVTHRQTLELRAGTYSLSATAEGYEPLALAFDVTLEGQQDVEVTLTELAPVLPPEDEVVPGPSLVSDASAVDATRPHLATPVTLAVLSAGAFAVGTVFHLQAAGYQDDFDAYPTSASSENLSMAQWDAIADDGRQAQTIGWVGVGVGSGLLIGAIVSGVVMNKDRTDESARGPSVSPTLSTDRVGVSVSW